MIARQAQIEDWNGLKACWHSLKDSRHAWKIHGDEAVLRSYFSLSLVHPVFGVLVLVDDSTGEVRGFAVLQECVNSSMDTSGQGMVNEPHSFIRALYVKSGTAPEHSAMLESEMKNWAIRRNHLYLCGNCRADFPDRFAKLYGYEVSHVVVKKSLKEVR